MTVITNLGVKLLFASSRFSSMYILIVLSFWKKFEELYKWLAITVLFFADPEVHIPLENLQQFPAFNSYTCSSDSALGPTSTEGHGSLSLSTLSRSPGSHAGK